MVVLFNFLATPPQTLQERWIRVNNDQLELVPKNEAVEGLGLIGRVQHCFGFGSTGYFTVRHAIKKIAAEQISQIVLPFKEAAPQIKTGGKPSLGGDQSPLPITAIKACSKIETRKQQLLQALDDKMRLCWLNTCLRLIASFFDWNGSASLEKEVIIWKHNGKPSYYLTTRSEFNQSVLTNTIWRLRDGESCDVELHFYLSRRDEEQPTMVITKDTTILEQGAIFKRMILRLESKGLIKDFECEGTVSISLTEPPLMHHYSYPGQTQNIDKLKCCFEAGRESLSLEKGLSPESLETIFQNF